MEKNFKMWIIIKKAVENFKKNVKKIELISYIILSLNFKSIHKLKKALKKICKNF